MREFEIELCGHCVQVLDQSVQRAGTFREEEKAMSAGRRILLGSRNLADLHKIALWKAPRSAHHIQNAANSPERVTRALDIAVSDEATSTALKVDALDELVGVGVPMASAILTCIDPKNYTVIDVRALDALRAAKRNINRDLYVRYLEFCRATAQRLGVELRQLDRALWKSGSIQNGQA